MNDTTEYIILAIASLFVIANVVVGLAIMFAGSRGIKKDNQQIRNNLRSIDTSLDKIAVRAQRRNGVINIGSWEVWDPYKPFGPDNPKPTGVFNDRNH